MTRSYPTLAAALSRADRVGEGDPHIVGTRNAGRLGMTGPAELRAGGDFVVPTRRLASSFGDLGADLAHALIAQLRTTQSRMMFTVKQIAARCNVTCPAHHLGLGMA